MTTDGRNQQRNFPVHTLTDALRVAQALRDVNAGRPMNRLLLADAINIKPSSSNYRTLLSSSLKYGLTTGTEKAAQISLTPLGTQATGTDPVQQAAALRRAAMTPDVLSKFYKDFDNAKVPATDMLTKILVANYQVPDTSAMECASLLITNGEAVGLIRSIAGSRHVLLDGADAAPITLPDSDVDDQDDIESEVPAEGETVDPADQAQRDRQLIPDASERPGAIFLGHGKNKGPLNKIEKLLTGFKIPFKMAVTEPNLGRPIPVKVRETMLQCGSAILIFTKDQKFTNEAGDEIWRPSENVVHELGAASLLYEDRIVIFKEKGLDLASNFSSIGYIEFDEDAIEAKTAELLGELVGFNLVKITPV